MTNERKVLVKMMDRAYHMMEYVSEAYEGAKAREAVNRWWTSGTTALHLWCSTYGYDQLDFAEELDRLYRTRDALLIKINHRDVECNG